MAKNKSSKKNKRKKRRKLSKLLTSMKKVKLRIPTAKGGFPFKTKKDYNRSENRKIAQREVDV